MLLLLMQMKLKTVLTLFFCLLLIYLTLVLVAFLRMSNSETQKVAVLPAESAIEWELEEVLRGNPVSVQHPEIPVMVWWTPFSGDTGLQHCSKYSCYITNNRSYLSHPSLKTVFFYGTDFQPTNLPLPRRKDLDWALIHEESPKNNPIFSHEDVMVLFNHTATFRLGSDFPLTTQYLESIESLTDASYSVPLPEKNRLQADEGLAPVVYVQSGCETPSGRDLWVEEFMKHIPVDSYGQCLHNKDLPSNIVGSEKMADRKFLELMSKYKFHLSVENSVCDDYVTEKLWRPLQLGSVPLYLGAPNIEEYLPNENSAVLLKDFPSPKEAAHHVKMLNNNDAKYLKHLQHKPLNKQIGQDLVTNNDLVDILENRRWGVSSRQQMELGNFVLHFQCFVCNRVARNLKFTKIGFQSEIHRASQSHYGCPVPRNPLTKQVDQHSWYTEEWFRSKYAAALLREVVEKGGEPPDKQTFDNEVLQRWNRDFTSTKV